MKTMMKSIIAVVLFVATTGIAIATQPVLKVVGENSFILSIDDVKSDMNISIEDESGYKLFTKKVNSTEATFVKTFNVEALPNGTYTLSVEDDIKVVTISVEVENNTIVNKEIANAKAFKPVVYKKGENVYVSKFSPENKPVNVVIYNSNYDVVHEETIANVNLGRVYTFKNAGDYKIAVTSENKTYEHTVSINK